MSTEEREDIPLHIPDAPFRPGDIPVFEEWTLAFELGPNPRVGEEGVA